MLSLPAILADHARINTVRRYTHIPMVTLATFSAIGLIAIVYQTNSCYMDLSAFQEGSSEPPDSCKLVESWWTFVGAGLVGSAFLLVLPTLGCMRLWRAGRIIWSPNLPV